MPTKKIGTLQIGKQGITDNFISSLKKQFDTHENIKISVLRSATRNREDMKKLSNEILEKLGKKFTAKTIGFTIVIKKWRREVR